VLHRPPNTKSSLSPATCHALALASALWLAALVAPPSANASESDPQLDEEGCRAVVAAIGDLIEQKYVDPDVGSEAIAQIQINLDRGDYCTSSNPRDLAGSLTRDLSSFDRHFHVFWAPAGSGPAPGAHGDEAESAWQELSRLQNFGFEQVARLPGNLGYLDLRYFDGVEQAGSTAVAAMGFLAHTDAVIVDLRQNGGGEPAMVQLLASYFFGPERVHYNSFYSRGSDLPEQYWTLARVEGDCMPDVSLYILTARRTGSAAEGFSYALQALGRATIIGQTTAGAAHPGETFEAIEGFSIFVSTGKPVNPVTGSNWEKIGVQPDIEVAADEALDRARVLALEGLLQSEASPVATLEWEWALEALLALQDPHALAPEQSAEYAGTYGNREISEQEGHLFYRRGDRRSYEMVYLGDDRFLLDGKSGFRLEFERDADGSVVRLLDHWSDGHIEANVRD